MKERNITLDYFKLFLSFLVILIHIQPITGVWNSFGSYFISNGYARIAVPCFYIINGYYLFSKIGNVEKVSIYIKKTLIIYCVWTLIYLGIISQKPIDFIDYFLLFFMGIGNLWYVAALIIAVPLYYLIVRLCKKDSVLFTVAIVLFLCGYTIQHFLKIMVVEQFDNFNLLNVLKCRNALFFALPFIILGGIVKSNFSTLSKIATKHVVMAMIASLMALTFEIYYSYSTFYASDFYVATFILCPSLFLLVLKHSKYSNNSDFIGHLSQAVYFVHPIAIWTVFSIFSLSYFGSDKLFYIPIIFFCSLLMSTGIIRLNKEIKIFL